MNYKLPVNYEKISAKQRREVREQYVFEQQGLCYWCQSSLFDVPPSEMKEYEIDWDLFPSNFLRHPVHLQHNHDTGMTEGAVHSLCNAIMWQYFGR